MTNKYSLGDQVIATPLTKDCLATEEFLGTVIAIKNDLYIVEDQDGDCWDMDEQELELQDN